MAGNADLSIAIDQQYHQPPYQHSDLRWANTLCRLLRGCSICSPYLPHAVAIPLHGLGMQSRPYYLDLMQPVLVSSFESDPLLCTVACYREYISRTLLSHRSSQSAHSQLLLANVKPHKPVVSSTIARWIKCVLLASGVDVLQHYTFHQRGSNYQGWYFHSGNQGAGRMVQLEHT